MNDRDPPLADKSRDSGRVMSALKDQLALISSLILFAGLAATDTYYAGFGIRYQLLDLPVQHLVYRGLTAIFQSHALCVGYIVVVYWLSGAWPWLLRRYENWANSLQVATYTVVIVVVSIAYFSGISAGRTAANSDEMVTTSSLPIIQAIKDSHCASVECNGCRLLLSGKDTVAIFKPVNSPNEVPLIHLLKREDIGEITLSR